MTVDKEYSKVETDPSTRHSLLQNIVNYARGFSNITQKQVSNSLSVKQSNGRKKVAVLSECRVKSSSSF